MIIQSSLFPIPSFSDILSRPSCKNYWRCVLKKPGTKAASAPSVSSKSSPSVVSDRDIPHYFLLFEDCQRFSDSL